MLRIKTKKWRATFLAFVTAVSVLPISTFSASLHPEDGVLGEPVEDTSPITVENTSGEYAVLLDDDDTDTNMRSGCLNMDKLTEEEIIQLLRNNSLTMPETVYEELPSYSSPYASGKLTDELLQAALNRLNAIRTLAGLPATTLDDTLNENAQYGAVLLGTEGVNFSINPTKPENMEDEFYEKAHGATAKSNIYGRRTLLEAVDGFMEDYQASSIVGLGHRRWQLKPTLGKVGFGYVESSPNEYEKYSVETITDASGTPGDYNFIAWPSSGNFPNSIFPSRDPWSISLNVGKYATPVQSELTVTLEREEDGRIWTFGNGATYTPADSGEYFGVDVHRYGVPNCIIFRPSNITTYTGSYTVTVEGLKNLAGDSVDFSYQVDFFDPTLADKVTVTLDPNGGTVSPTTIEVNETYGDLPIPSRPAYLFSGWYTALHGGTEVTDATPLISDSEHTLYAHWAHILTSGVIQHTAGANSLDYAYNRDDSSDFVTILSDIPNNHSVLVANYDSNGRQIGLKILTTKGEKAQVEDGTSSLSLFWLNGNNIPQSQKTSFNRPR